MANGKYKKYKSKQELARRITSVRTAISSIRKDPIAMRELKKLSF